ncbi:MAG: hypothetical protein H7A24_16435 [Leptospiraceae bacterium]|nr:hypothetical protein [Leptospiraceae bacterium]MCP5513477.1 hypothetical protein [Leptospiraceae bacterium]
MYNSSMIKQLIDKEYELFHKHQSYGQMIWELNDTSILSTLKLIYTNRPASDLLGYDISNFHNHSLGESFQDLLKSEFPSTITKVILSGSPQYIYNLKYTDGHSEDLNLVFKIFPLTLNLAVTFFKKFEMSSEMLVSNDLLIASSSDIILVKKMVKELAQDIYIVTFKIFQLIVACTELSRNLLLHSNGGVVSISTISGENGQLGIRVQFRDKGPGIFNLDQAMTDGFSSKGTLGIGLGVAKRAVDDFKIDSNELGTFIQIITWRSDYMSRY